MKFLMKVIDFCAFYMLNDRLPGGSYYGFLAKTDSLAIGYKLAITYWL